MKGLLTPLLTMPGGCVGTSVVCVPVMHDIHISSVLLRTTGLARWGVWGLRVASARLYKGCGSVELLSWPRASLVVGRPARCSSTCTLWWEDPHSSCLISQWLDSYLLIIFVCDDRFTIRNNVSLHVGIKLGNGSVSHQWRVWPQ